MKQPMSWNALLEQAATASVVSKPVMKKKPVTDAIYGVAEPKRKVQPKKYLTDAELQSIWDRNKAKMRSQTATAYRITLASSPNPLLLNSYSALALPSSYLSATGIR